MTKQPNSYTFQLNNLKMHVHEWGKANQCPSLLFLHATGFHGRCWDSIVDTLGDYHCLAVDLRGHGKSDTLDFETWADFGSDVVELIEQLDLENVIIIGHSLGGFTATYAAHELPSRVTKLLLIDPVILRQQYYADQIDMSQATRFSKLRTDSFESPNAFFERYKTRPPYMLFDSKSYQSYCDHALQWNETDNTYQLACRPEFEAKIYTSLFSFKPIYEVIGNITQPTHILRAMNAPSEDKFYGFQYSPTNPDLHTCFQNGKETHLQELTHFIPQQDPKLTASFIEQLIAE